MITVEPLSLVKRLSFHENSIVELRFDPERGQLRIVMDEPIEGGNGLTTLVISGVRSLSVSGSTTGGETRFIPGGEVLTLEVNEIQDLVGHAGAWRFRFLLSPLARLVRPDTGLSIIEAVGDGMRLE